MLLKTEVIKRVNVDGSHGKIGLKSFPNFYGALTGIKFFYLQFYHCVYSDIFVPHSGAIAKMPFKGLTPEDILRSALKFEKAKEFKKAYRQRKKNFEN